MIETLKTFTALSEEFVELFMKHHPVEATQAGIHDYDHELPDDSPDGLKARAAWLRDLEQRLVASVPWTELPLDARVDFALLRSRIAALRADLEETKVPQRDPTLFLERAFRGVHLLLSRSFAPLDERKEAAVARLMAIPDYLDAARANLDVVPPVQLEAGIELAARGPGFVDDVVRRLLRQFPGEAERLEHAGSRARTGFLRLHDHLDRDLRAKSGGTFALSERWLNYRLEREHMLELDATGIESLARDEIARYVRLLDEEARRIDAKQSWRALLALGAARHPESNWLREAYAAEIDRARRFVADRGVVALPAGERLELGETPAYERGLSPQACYQGPAPFDADPTGLFQLTPIDLRRDKPAQARQLAGHCLPMLPLIALRETYPGHHVQQAYANRAATRLRRIVRSSVFVEGWAFYAEDMMGEAGFLAPDPYSKLFQLLWALRRACLAVIDVGLHAERMTVDEAVGLLVDETAWESETAVAQVRAICIAPGRGLAALVGRTALRDLREECEQRLGARFDRAAFHAAVLAGGALPFALVREELFERLGIA